ncbi:S-adenosyl-L-methionine-dependent methyltransferase [Artomyces pyxidatus]|uniref:S-adenosyl-L-methionine-dependent methyltransferase n=1 Tax=Artomyces pyxidatus TaxID=48021 RepID=A0ACB8T5W9_9AGAM|nr:S-adenosyl-L-methionine-dependent methyltransferase [Artomyces pyxidatus]
MPDTNPLIALADIIASGVRTLESAYSKQGVSFPSLDEPYRPEQGSLDNDAAVTAATHLIVAAAHQLIATVRQPFATLRDYATGVEMTSSLGLITEVNVPDALKDEQAGLHVDVIGKKVDVDSKKLARVLRYLATRHVFKEVAPDVFANNRVSSALVKSRSLEQLKADKLTQYDGASAAATVGHMTDEALMSNTSLVEYIRDAPKSVETPFNLAFKTNATLWEWYEEPGNEWRGRRFTNAMAGGAERFPPMIITGGFDWESLKAGSVIVDVGGSVGAATLTLAKDFPHLKFIVQDLPKVISESAQKYWRAQAPEFLANKTVTLQAHNFFEPQPVRDASVYFMRSIIHDWPDAKCITILKQLRAAAAPSSRLVLFDTIMPYACPHPSGPPPPPFPLLANLGLAVGGFVTAMDLQMMILINGEERTLSQFVELGNATGWKLESIKPGMLAALVFSVV